jgi:hypothetical protein
MWLTLRDIWTPGVQTVRWSPVRRLGPVSLVSSRDPAAVDYQFLGSHPAYVLMDLLAGVIPAFLTFVSWGDDPRLNQTMHVYHWWLIVWALIPFLRIFCWFVLRRGPATVSAMTPGMAPAERRRYEWQTFWHGPLVFWIIALTALIPGCLIAVRDARKTEENTPLLTAAVIKEIYRTFVHHDDERYRLRGKMRGPLQHWPEANGKYAGAGFVVELEDGPEIAVFVEAGNIKAVEKLTAGGSGISLTCLIRTLEDGGKEIPPHYDKYYSWSESSLGPVPEAAASFTYTGRRFLTRYVDP